METKARVITDEDVQSKSKCGAFAQGMCVAFCVAPLVTLFAIFLTGWNEKISVCTMHAIDDGFKAVTPAGCTDSLIPGTLSMFSCDINKAGLHFNGDWDGASGMEAFKIEDFTGVGLSAAVEMYQCYEVVTKQNQKQLVNGVEKTVEVTTYQYKFGWRSQPVLQFQNPNGTRLCGGPNPQWPYDIHQGTIVARAPVVKVGSHELSQDFRDRIPLTTKAFPTMAKHSPWKASNGEYLDTSRGLGHVLDKPDHMVQQESPGTTRGTLRARFYTNSDKPLTVLGEHTSSGIGEWVAPDAWLCSGSTLGEVREGKLNKAQLFENLHAENGARTVFLRILCFCMFWGAFFCMVHPLGLLADCIPLCGDCLGDFIDGLMCIAACGPAFACFFTVAGVVWVVMRPMIGGPMLLTAVVVTAYYMNLRSQRKSKEGPSLLNNNVAE